MTNKDLKKRRMLSYFIRSTQNIIKEDGISGVTLRKVAQGAGYNVATLYNYFEDLDQLVLFACLKYLQIYNQALNEQLTDCNSAKEKFYLSWRIFVKFLLKIRKLFIRFSLINTVIHYLRFVNVIMKYFPKREPMLQVICIPFSPGMILTHVTHWF